MFQKKKYKFAGFLANSTCQRIFITGFCLHFDRKFSQKIVGLQANLWPN
jgi:hypothetical protein